MAQQEIWTTRQEVQKAAASNNAKPIWGHQKNLEKQHNRHQNIPICKKDGTETKDTTKTMKRWTQGIQTHFPHTIKENENIRIEHIKEETWRRVENIQNGTQSGAPNEELLKKRQETPLYKWQKPSNSSLKTTLGVFHYFIFPQNNF